ncbi:alpha/beta fold hydrolase [Streptomyces sp. NPDC059443]|uniref:alpha/beta fold hydrolase n=1 Tax=unclassified Streptomyces TaxID=2593676 RepID=UPI0036A12E3D
MRTTLEVRRSQLPGGRQGPECWKDTEHSAAVDAAKDMDLLRQALGEEMLTFHGRSFGSYVGTVYAAQFPRRVHALVTSYLATLALPARGTLCADETPPEPLTRRGSGIEVDETRDVIPVPR